MSAQHHKFTRAMIGEKLITPLPVKLAVLKRLSAITAQDISVVLMEIADDLRRQGGRP